MFQSLRAEGLQVTDAIVFFDREQNGANNLQEKGIHLHRYVSSKCQLSETIDCRVLTMTQVLEYLLQAGRITEEVSKSVQRFVRENQIQLPTPNVELEMKPITIPIRERFEKIRKEKKSNLCLSADLTSLDEIIEVENFERRNWRIDDEVLVSETSGTEYLYVENSL